MDKKDWQQIGRMLGLITQVGLTIAVSIGIGFFLGRVIDRALGFSFVATPIFLLFGVGAGYRSIHELFKNLLKKNNEEDECGKKN